MAKQTRLDALYQAADDLICEHPEVYATEKQSFRIGNRVFIRLERDADVRMYCYKLTTEDAQAMCSRYEYVTPMKFGGMDKKGWVSFRLTRKQQLASLKSQIGRSYNLFRKR